MEEFGSLHPQKELAELLASSETAPVVLLNRGQPRVVLMSAEEFCRLKRAAGEAVPRAALPRRAAVVRGRGDDPLGYDTSDLLACAREMADAALSGRNRRAVEAELVRVRGRFGRTRAGVDREAERGGE